MCDIQEDAVPTRDRSYGEDLAARPDEASHPIIKRTGPETRRNDKGNHPARLGMPKAQLCEQGIFVDVPAVGHTTPGQSAHLLDRHAPIGRVGDHQPVGRRNLDLECVTDNDDVPRQCRSKSIRYQPARERRQSRVDLDAVQAIGDILGNETGRRHAARYC